MALRNQVSFRSLGLLSLGKPKPQNAERPVSPDRPISRLRHAVCPEDSPLLVPPPFPSPQNPEPSIHKRNLQAWCAWSKAAIKLQAPSTPVPQHKRCRFSSDFYLSGRRLQPEQLVTMSRKPDKTRCDAKVFKAGTFCFRYDLESAHLGRPARQFVKVCC